jgi:hypothetical protein
VGVEVERGAVFTEEKRTFVVVADLGTTHFRGQVMIKKMTKF